MKHFSPVTVRLLLAISFALLIAAPYVLYPQFLIEILCFALLAAALNLLVSYCGLLSFGHAMFFGAAGYVTAHAIKVWGFDPALGEYFASFNIIISYLFDPDGIFRDNIARAPGAHWPVGG